MPASGATLRCIFSDDETCQRVGWGEQREPQQAIAAMLVTVDISLLIGLDASLNSRAKRIGNNLPRWPMVDWHSACQSTIAMAAPVLCRAAVAPEQLDNGPNMWGLDFGEVERALRSALVNLENAGFDFERGTVHISESLGPCATYCWSSPVAQRSLRVKYVPGANTSHLGLMFVDIVNLHPNPTAEDDYMTTNAMRVSLPGLESLEGEPSQRLRTWAALIGQKVDAALWPVLSGRDWREERFDWGDLK